VGRFEDRELGSWNEFGHQVQEIRRQYGYLNYGDEIQERNVILFRGHACSDWPLETTLERDAPTCTNLYDYLAHAIGCAPEIESISGRSWDLPTLGEIVGELGQKKNRIRTALPCYEYLVYLRHHGFPSPLLDWTESPYIAAFFAFSERSNCDRVSIYAYIERTTLGKGGRISAPRISLQGPYIRTDPRHFAQKAWYTVATVYDHELSQHTFCSHESVLKGDPDQDVVIRLTLPRHDRSRALLELYDYNINHFTLFQTEDALVQSLAMKEFDSDIVLFSPVDEATCGAEGDDGAPLVSPPSESSD
jgi:hypothetical protein